MSSKHPANNGKVSMMAWVDPALRDYARTRARESGVTVSEWIGEAVRLRVLSTSLGRYCFPCEEPGCNRKPDEPHTHDTGMSGLSTTDVRDARRPR